MPNEVLPRRHAQTGGVSAVFPELSPYLLWRRAALPASALAPLIPDATWATLDTLFELQGSCASQTQEGQGLMRVLHACVPKAAPSQRRALLSVKRAVFAGRPADPVDIAIARKALGPHSEAKLLDWATHMEQISDLYQKAEQQWHEERRGAQEVLSALVGHDVVARGLQFSGKSLQMNMRRFVEYVSTGTDGGKRMRRAQDTLVSFLYRISYKTSPFGAFTRIGAQPVSGAGDTQTRRVRYECRLSRMMLDWVESEIQALEPCRAGLPLWPAVTRWSEDGRVAFFTRGRDGTHRMFGAERIFRLRAVTPVPQILSLLDAAPMSKAQLVAALEAHGVSVGSSAALIEHLIDIGLIERGFGLNAQIPDYAPKIREVMASLPSDAPIATCQQALTRITEIEKTFGEASVQDRADALKQLQAEIERIAAATGATMKPDDAEAPPLYEDAYETGPALRWTKSAMDAVQPDLRRLHRLFPLLDDSLIERLSLHRYVINRYGADKPVPILTLYSDFSALDPQVVTRLMQGESNPNVADIVALRGRFWLHIARLVTAAQANAARQAQLDPDWVDAFVSEFPAELAPWPSVSMQLQLGLDAQWAPSTVLNGLGPGYGARFSRFANGLDSEFARGGWNLKDALHQHLNGHAGRDGPLADLAPVLGVNTNLHPSLTPIDVMYPRTCPDRADRAALSLGDIRAVAESGTSRIRLLDAEGRSFTLAPQNFLYPLAGPGLYRFLFLFSDFVNVRNRLWQEFRSLGLSDPNAIGLPRLSLGRIVVARAQSVLPATSIPDVVRQARDDIAGLIAVDRWRCAVGLPRTSFFTISDHTNPMRTADETWTDQLRRWANEARNQRRFKPHFLDLRSPFLTQVFLKKLRSAPDAQIVFEECLPQAGYGGSAEEWVIECNHGPHHGV